jgi:hypothetical protein
MLDRMPVLGVLGPVLQILAEVCSQREGRIA